MTRSVPFERSLVVDGWSGRSRWGFDVVLECYWAELWPADDGPAVRVGSEHLITTLEGLCRALAREARVRADEAYLALTA